MRRNLPHKFINNWFYPVTFAFCSTWHSLVTLTFKSTAWKLFWIRKLQAHDNLTLLISLDELFNEKTQTKAISPIHVGGIYLKLCSYLICLCKAALHETFSLGIIVKLHKLNEPKEIELLTSFQKNWRKTKKKEKSLKNLWAKRILKFKRSIKIKKAPKKHKVEFKKREKLSIKWHLKIREMLTSWNESSRKLTLKLPKIVPHFKADFTIARIDSFQVSARPKTTAGEFVLKTLKLFLKPYFILSTWFFENHHDSRDEKNFLNSLE